MIQDDYEKQVLKAFLDSIKNVKSTTQIKLLEAMIENNDLEGVMTALGIDRGALANFEGSISAAYVAGGIATAETIGRIPVQGGSLAFRFDVRDLDAEKWIADHSSQLIVEIVNDQRDAIKTTLENGLALGNNPRTTALDIVGRINPTTRARVGGVVGLTNQQTIWIENARQQLLDLDSKYFTRELRDKRFDSTIKKAIESNTPLTKSQIDKAITSMQNRALQYRAESIARTESLNALRAGQFESIKQAVRIGKVQERDVVKEWDASGDARTRATHADADGQVKPINEPFIVGGALLNFPGDSSLGAPASEVVQCRCRSITRIDFLNRAVTIRGFR